MCRQLRYLLFMLHSTLWAIREKHEQRHGCRFVLQAPSATVLALLLQHYDVFLEWAKDDTMAVLPPLDDMKVILQRHGGDLPLAATLYQVCMVYTEVKQELKGNKTRTVTLPEVEHVVKQVVDLTGESVDCCTTRWHVCLVSNTNSQCATSIHDTQLVLWLLEKRPTVSVLLLHDTQFVL
jgi:P2-related tail formation protein